MKKWIHAAEDISASGKLSADNFADYYNPDYYPEYDPKRLGDASKIDWYITIEDSEFVIDDVKDFPDLSVVKEVRYFNDSQQAWADSNGWDGGYNVRYRDGSTKQFAWHMGSSRMYELSPDEYVNLYVVRIWYEADPGRDMGMPVASEEIFEVYATDPEDAKEQVKQQWSGPIDGIEIVDVNPADTDEDLPFDDDAVYGSDDFLTPEQKEILRRADTSEWAQMQTEYMEDEIRNAGSYSEYVAKERKRNNR